MDYARDIDRCTPGFLVSPIFCKKLTNWLNLKTDIEPALTEEFYEDNI